MFQKYHLKWSLISGGWLADRPLGLIGDTQQRWAPDISLENNLSRQIYFPAAHYDQVQTSPIVPETTQRYATWLLDLQGNSLWLKGGNVAVSNVAVPSIEVIWSSRRSISKTSQFCPLNMSFTIWVENSQSGKESNNLSVIAATFKQLTEI